MCNFSPVNMKQEAPQAFKALMTEVTNLFSDLLYETVSWMQHLDKKKKKKKNHNQQTQTKT